ncbi:unnamed protein product [Oikopleura dioica]|uniref:chitinase n=1 Tax=Oikopleura dioica TaxID=34765 RepID=E4WQV5_OIKDI|nr:unnamed protein product [Oikopleura dioica]
MNIFIIFQDESFSICSSRFVERVFFLIFNIGALGVVRGQAFTTECLNDFNECVANADQLSLLDNLFCILNLFDQDCFVTEVPNPKKCEVDGLFRHWKKCDRFFQCNGGIRSASMKCPVTLLFNENKGVCDWPDNVDCGTLKIPKATIPDTADYTLDKNCPDGVSKSDDCFGFNSCVGGMKYKMDCPNNLMFNTLENVCDYKSRVCSRNAAADISCCE